MSDSSGGWCPFVRVFYNDRHNVYYTNRGEKSDIVDKLNTKCLGSNCQVYMKGKCGMLRGETMVFNFAGEDADDDDEYYCDCDSCKDCEYYGDCDDCPEKDQSLDVEISSN